jgi:hypothetical protein
MTFFRFFRRWWFLLLCIALMILAVSIRITGVAEKGFWRDEILTMKIHAPRMAEWRFPYIRALNGWITWKISRHTNDELLLRMPNIIAACLCVLVTGMWLRRAFGKWPAVAGILFLSITTCFVHHTSLCRSYGFLSLFVTLAAWSYWEWVEKPRTWHWAGIFLLCGPMILISRMEGIAVYATLIAAAPVLLVVRRPWNRQKFFVLCGVLPATVLLVAGITILTYRITQKVSVNTSILAAWNESYITFISKIIAGILKYISLDEAVFSLHHNFRYTHWLLPVWLILLIGLAWIIKTRWRLAVILIIWIITGQAATHWMLIDFFNTKFDARHMIHTVPALIIMFVAGTFAVLQFARRYIHAAKPRIIATVIGVAWLIVCSWQFLSILGSETVRFIRYERIADWKYAAALSHYAQTVKRQFCIHGHHYDMSYYPARLNRMSPTRYLQARQTLYFLPMVAEEVESSSLYQRYDTIKIPYEPAPAYVIYPDKTEGTSYWIRACRELDAALSLSPRHRQIQEALWSAWLFSGRARLDTLSNAPLLEAHLRKQASGTAHPLPGSWDAADWIPLDGWGQLETWDDGTQYRWSNGRRSTLLLPQYTGRLRSINLKVLPYHAPNTRNQEITAWLGSLYLGNKPCAGPWQDIQFTVPLHAVPGERRLMLEYRNPASPRLLKRGNDPRLLALALADITPSAAVSFNGSMLDVGTYSNAAWLSSGWSYPETWMDGTTYRWLEGTNGYIAWHPDSLKAAAQWEIRVLPFSVPGSQQIMRVSQSGTILTNILLQSDWQTCTILSPPGEAGNGLLQLTFSHAVSPRECGKGDDTRTLSAAISSITRK